MTRLEEIKRKLNLPCVSQSTTSEFVDAAPFVTPFTRGERVYKIADWIGQGKGTTTGSSTSPTLSAVGIEEDWTLSLTDATLTGLTSSMSTPVGRKAVRGVLPPKGIATSATGTLKPRTQKVKKNVKVL